MHPQNDAMRRASPTSLYLCLLRSHISLYTLTSNILTTFAKKKRKTNSGMYLCTKKGANFFLALAFDKPVYGRRVNSFVLICSLSSHRHYTSYLWLSLYRFIINFINKQEFSFRRRNQVASSPFAARLSSRRYRAK